MRDVHVVTANGREVYAGEALYSAAGGKLVFTGWNSLGGSGHGTAETRERALAFRLNIRATPDGAGQEISTVWRWTDEGAGYEAEMAGVIHRFRREPRPN